MYAQKIEGDSWKDEKIDKGKIDKMSGLSHSVVGVQVVLTSGGRSAARAAV